MWISYFDNTADAKQSLDKWNFGAPVTISSIPCSESDSMPKVKMERSRWKQKPILKAWKPRIDIEMLEDPYNKCSR